MTRDGHERLFVILGAASAFIGVGAGAVAPPPLEARLAPDQGPAHCRLCLEALACH